MIHLDYRDARPIYEQVKDGLRRLMVTGVLAPGEKLPSVRSLAMDLAINPNTIQRAPTAPESPPSSATLPAYTAPTAANCCWRALPFGRTPTPSGAWW